MSCILISQSSRLTSTTRLYDKVASRFVVSQFISILKPQDYCVNPARHFSTNLISNMSNATHFIYPKVDRDETAKEKIFDIEVFDPYRHLEDPDAERTKQFVSSQNAVTEPYLESFPRRQSLKKLLLNNQNYKRTGCPFRRGDKYYLFVNEGLQPQAVMYQQDSIDGEMRVFLDPNKFSEDGTASLSQISFSHDNRFMAYSVSYGGSDWQEIRVKNVETGEDLEDKIEKAKFTSLEWTYDNKGFFYSKFPDYTGPIKGTTADKLKNHVLYYHVLNTEQKEDIPIANFPDHPEWLVKAEIADDGKFLNIFASDGCHGAAWYYANLKEFRPSERLSLIPIYEKMDSRLEYLANDGDTVYFRTNIDADNYRIARLDLKNPSKENWTDVIPNHESDLLEWAEFYTIDGQDYLLINYMRKVVNYLELHKLGHGLVKRFDVGLGGISKYPGLRKHDEIFFQFTSFLTPGQTYYYNLKDTDSQPRLLRQSQPSGFNPDDYNINQVFYNSKDGTEIPMFIVSRKDLVRDGKNPCLLYGYGGFNIKITSAFNINRVAWLKNFKGVLAVSNIRGGGELGQKWHDAGRLLNKQNCFDDFAAAAEYLIKEKYTRTDKLVIEGGSNGGLLVAAAANQRPDLFGAILCHVGVLDMLRYHIFTIGEAWQSDYGNPGEEKHFKNLFKFSPYHNVPGNVESYPATLLLTADHDDRVVPAHSLKFIAELQYKLGLKLPTTPLLARIDTKSGHGAGKPVSKIIDQYLDIYSFLYRALDLKDYYSED